MQEEPPRNRKIRLNFQKPLSAHRTWRNCPSAWAPSPAKSGAKPENNSRRKTNDTESEQSCWNDSSSVTASIWSYWTNAWIFGLEIEHQILIHFGVHSISELHSVLPPAKNQSKKVIALTVERDELRSALNQANVDLRTLRHHAVLSILGSCPLLEPPKGLISWIHRFCHHWMKEQEQLSQKRRWKICRSRL